MKWFILIVAVLGISFVFTYSVETPHTPISMENTTNYKKSDCAVLGVNFEFPDFKDWEYKYTEKVNENLCIMYFNWPNNIEYEVPPRMHIYKIPKSAEMGGVDVAKTPRNIPYERVQDPSLYVMGHKFEAGDWDWIVFRGPNFDIKMEHIMFGEESFDKDLFYRTIIETLNFE